MRVTEDERCQGRAKRRLEVVSLEDSNEKYSIYYKIDYRSLCKHFTDTIQATKWYPFPETKPVTLSCQ